MPRKDFETAMLDAGEIYTSVALVTHNNANDYDYGMRVFVDCGDGDRSVGLTLYDQRIASSFLWAGGCG